jgi:hypothetical protein
MNSVHIYVSNILMLHSVQLNMYVLSLVLCVFHSAVLCGYERSVELILFCMRSMGFCMLLPSAQFM